MKLTAWERSVLEWIIPELRALLTAGSSPHLRRLFPTAHAGDPDAEAEYQLMVHDQLLEQRLAALDTIEATMPSSTLTEDEAMAWLHAINGTRLVLGSRLDVGQDDPPALHEDDPDLRLWIAYDILTTMLAQLVDALDR